jgi:hypothetical protein
MKIPQTNGQKELLNKYLKKIIIPRRMEMQEQMVSKEITEMKHCKPAYFICVKTTENLWGSVDKGVI